MTLRIPRLFSLPFFPYFMCHKKGHHNFAPQPNVMPETGKNIKQLARQIKDNPDDSFSKFALALEFLKQQKLKKSRILFEDIYKNDPGYAGVYYHLGKLYERLNLSDNAVKIYNEGINIAAKQNEARTEKELREALARLEAELEN